jgi:hypothetical protein
MVIYRILILLLIVGNYICIVYIKKENRITFQYYKINMLMSVWYNFKIAGYKYLIIT